jgi:hypothetical protein
MPTWIMKVGVSSDSNNSRLNIDDPDSLDPRGSCGAMVLDAARPAAEENAVEQFFPNPEILFVSFVAEYKDG